MNPLNNYRGQVTVFYALLIPVFLFLGGVGLDLGWYYLNVSRLQNAADAAVLVGAKTLTETHDLFKTENYKVKLVYQYPKNSPVYELDEDGNPKLDEEGKEQLIDTKDGDLEALKYAKKNLGDYSASCAPPSLFSVAQAAVDKSTKDGYTRGNNTVTMETGLYQDGEDYFYVIGLSEDIHHFFIGFLPDMEAPVVAVALISKNIDDSGGDGDSSVDDIKITFDPRGGIFNDGKSDKVTKTYKDPATLTEEDDPQLITTDKGKPTRSDANFIGWSYTNPDDVEDYTKINIYYEGDTLTEERLNKIKENGGVLYAVYDPIDKVIPHNNITLWEQMQYLIAKNVYPYYWYAAKNKYGQDPINNRFNDVKVYYGDPYTETIYKDEEKIPIDKNTYNTHKNNYGKYKSDDGNYYELYKKNGKYYYIIPGHYETVTTNDRNYYAERLDLGTKAHGNKTMIGEQTHYYIDFWQADGNLTFQGTDSKGEPVFADTERTYIQNKSNKTRIHSLFNVNTTYTARDGYGDDPLYCRIEAEPYVSEYTPIRQIVINVNESNLANDKRPLFFYYDGPDARKNMSVSESNPGKLDPDAAQPVILNLNADFKGVLWMPDIPVVINGNGHTFQGFIMAKEYRYLDTENGTPVKYSLKGKTDANYTNSDPSNEYLREIRVDENGNVYSKLAEVSAAAVSGAGGSEALALWNNGANPFNLNQNSEFKTFNAANGVKYSYVHYDFDTLELDKTAFYDDLTGELIPLYKLEDGKQVRVTKWDDVNLYGETENGTRKPIPKKITSSTLSTIKDLTRSTTLKNTNDLNQFRGIVLLDGDDKDMTHDNNPIPLYDEAGNPVYFCEDYVKLTGSYNVFTLDKMADGIRNSKEFLLKKASASNVNVSDTKEWI